MSMPFLRTRTREAYGYGTQQHIPSGTFSFKRERYGPYVIQTMSDSPRKPGPLQVSMHNVQSFSQIDSSEQWLFIYEMWPLNLPLLPRIDENRLKWNKLPTSNGADLLTAFAELDDTIAMFGKKLVSSLSYGGYKWGWTPLLSDISAINDAANAVKNSVLDGNRRTCPYNTTDSYTIKAVPFWDGAYLWTQTANVKVKFSGSITYENDVCSFYDYMGFHPSPKLFWDLVPMSFAIDYVLPIGDMLSNITPSRGWVKYANFTGWRVTTVDYETTLTPSVGPNGQRSAISLKSSVIKSPSRYVNRVYCRSEVLESKRQSKDINFKFPTIEQAFDIGYLSNTLMSGRNKKSKRLRST